MSNLFISQANSIGYAQRESDGTAPEFPNPENRLSYEETNAGFKTDKSFCHRFKEDDIITQQIGSNIKSTTPVINVFQPEPTAAITPTLKKENEEATDPDDYRYYWEFDIDLSLYTDKTIQIAVTQGTDYYLSERIRGCDLSAEIKAGSLRKTEWGNSAKPSDYTNFQLYYGSGISFYNYIPAVLREQGFDVEENVYPDINKKTLLEVQLFKKYTLEVDYVPNVLSRIIVEAGKHFYFKVNGLQYLSEGDPDINYEKTNFSSVTLTLTAINSMGFNTDNRELEGETVDAIKISKEEAITSTWSFTKEKGYLLHLILFWQNIGSIADYTVKIGTTPGGNELYTDDEITIPLTGGLIPVTIDFHEIFSLTAATIIYIEITGAGAIGAALAHKILSE